MMAVVGIDKKIIIQCKDIAGTHIGSRQSGIFRTDDIEYSLGVISQILSQFITEACPGLPVPKYLYTSFHPYGAMVGGEHHLISSFCYFQQQGR